MEMKKGWATPRSQATVDTNGHLIPSANVSFVDRLDEPPPQEEETVPRQNAIQAQLPGKSETKIPSDVDDLIWWRR